MDFFGVTAGIILIWAWMNPHKVGQWWARFKDPYKEIPRHKENG